MGDIHPDDSYHKDASQSADVKRYIRYDPNDSTVANGTKAGCLSVVEDKVKRYYPWCLEASNLIKLGLGKSS